MGRLAAAGGSPVWSAALVVALGCGGETGKTDNAADTNTWTNTSTGSYTGTGTGTRTSTGLGGVTDTGVVTTTGQGTSIQTGVGSTYPVCNTAGASLTTDAGARVFSGVDPEAGTFAGPVTVEEVCQRGEVLSDPCLAPTAGDALRLSVVDATQGAWTVTVTHPKLSPDFFEAGETLDLDLFAWADTNFFGTMICQNVQLSRAGVLILIAHSCRAPAQSARVPTSGKGVPAGVTVGPLALTDAGIACAVTGGGFCDYWYHRANVQISDTKAVVEPGQTEAVGDYSFTLSHYRDAVDTGNCDFSSEVQFIAIHD